LIRVRAWTIFTGEVPMFPLDREILLFLNGLVGGSRALFETALLFCGALPLVGCVMLLLALWWTDPERQPAGVSAPVLAGRGAPESAGQRVARRRCVALAGGIAAAFICSRLIAFATDFPRPLGREPLAVPIDPERWGHLVSGMTGFGAFPSDHAALFFALAVGLFAWSRGSGVAGLLAAVLLSMVRVAVGFHYPSDMVVGGAIGATFGGLALKVAGRPDKGLDGVVALFDRYPALMYPLLFVVALDFTQHFRLVFRTIFFFLLSLLGAD
jgi:undecaprenyl-diphosphatase